MDKNAIKKFAVWARTELIARVSLKGVEYGITEDNIEDANADSVGGKVLTADEKKQRQALIAEINDKGYKQVMEEVAYTWFNRFSALRFMEVNGYLPSHVRVFTDEENNFKPQIITEAIHLDLDGLDMEKVYELKDAEKTEELYKYLLIVQCNALNKILPGMFQKIADYTELLLPDNLLREGSVIQQMIELISEDDWKDAVQIIGWLYQYYNSEKKDDVFAALKKNVKITKENIPAATQLFTPDWIVRYMVENSLGRLWVEGHPDCGLKENWKYYLEEAQQEPEVQAKLAEIRKEYAALNPEDIKLIDPCMGSGHILVYAFDVLMQIYESAGYSQRDAAKSILEHNIYGLDIDDRAYQLAYFAVMMKARQYNRRILNGENTCHVYAIQESNGINRAHLKYFGAGMDDIEKNAAKMQLEGLLDTMTDAKEYGSILNVESYNWDLLRRFVAAEDTDGQISMDSVGVEETAEQLNRLIDIGETMAQKYWVTCTNPPYAGTSNLSAKVNNFVKKNYPDSKVDLFAVFIERCRQMTGNNGFQAMITQHSWMFLSKLVNLRVKIQRDTIVNLVHLGARAFEEIGGEVVQTASFVFAKNRIKGYQGKYYRLVNYSIPEDKEKGFLNHANEYIAKQENYQKIPDAPISYHLNPEVYSIFEKRQYIGDVGAAKQGLATSDNNRFLRFWPEINFDKIGFGILGCEKTVDSPSKWFPYIKGGTFRRWYPNKEYVVNYQNNGFEIKAAVMKKYPYLNNPDFVVKNTSAYFHAGITWSDVATGKFSARWVNDGYIFADAGPMLFVQVDPYVKMGYMNTPVFQMFCDLICQGLHYSTGQIPQIPYLQNIEDKNFITASVDENIQLSKEDWDSFETSWDFKKHPLLRNVSTISEAFNQWRTECDDRFNRLKANEEELNRIFIDIYGLQDELTPEVEDKDVTVRKADLQRDIKSLLSYAVGCMFGRYSTYKDGLLFAGEPYSLQAFVDKMNDRPGTISDEELERAYRNEGVVVDEMFFPDADNVIPITDEEYLDDDIVSRLCAWLKAVYGADTLEENLDYIAKALGNKGSTSREIIRNYFLNDFFKDHCQTYSVAGSGKRPIYWLFDSGKQNGFKALVYLHRYTPDTIGNLRIDYLHKMQRVYESEINRMQDMMDHSENAREVAAASKRKDKLAKQLKECREYDEKISHLALSRIELDLDDGVKVNYRKLQTAQDGKFYEVLADSKNIMVKEKK